LHSRISAAAALFALAFIPVAAPANQPTVAMLDARARASGNRLDIAQRVGDVIFATERSAQVMQVYANALDEHLVLGLRLSGVKFHQSLTREQFSQEVLSLVAQAFAAEPAAEEVDVWASVPISVGKGVIVSGDLAKPTSRTVFTLTALRSDPQSELAERLQKGTGVYWDEDWARTAFKQGT
jgi:hypothetical protein